MIDIISRNLKKEVSRAELLEIISNSSDADTVTITDIARTSTPVALFVGDDGFLSSEVEVSTSITVIVTKIIKE